MNNSHGITWRGEILVYLCAILIGGTMGCASMKAAYQNMTPAQKARYSINVTYTVANEALNLASIFIDNQEDVDAIKAKLKEITMQVTSSVNVILALIPPSMEGVSEYGQEKVNALQANLKALMDSVVILEAIEPDE